MQTNKICKTIHQYNKKPLPPEDMYKLQEIAEDYRTVKNYVYQRYSGIRSLLKIYPGYTVQNEMTECGLRTQIGMPSVYFYLAVFDALGDIKTQWAKTKTRILEATAKNPRFTEADKHYLRFVMKVGGCFENILNGRTVVIPQNMQQQYKNIIMGTTNKVDIENLNRYLCRQVRRKRNSLHTEKADGFSIAERAYRYGNKDGACGIFISTKENRRRVFVPLTDDNKYKKQLYIKLLPEKSSIEIAVPIEVSVRIHSDFIYEVGISMGVWQMFTTDRGHIYGEQLGKMHEELTEFTKTANAVYQREKNNNPGRVKYKRQRQKRNASMESYINQEINHMLEMEKPKVIYLPKLPKNSAGGLNRQINYSVSVWRRGYIRNRLAQKCRENGIELVEVLGKGISTECSECGAIGKFQKDVFCCICCGYEDDKKINAARNAIKRGKKIRNSE